MSELTYAALFGPRESFVEKLCISFDCFVTKRKGPIEMVMVFRQEWLMRRVSVLSCVQNCGNAAKKAKFLCGERGP